MEADRPAWVFNSFELTLLCDHERILVTSMVDGKFDIEFMDIHSLDWRVYNIGVGARARWLQNQHGSETENILSASCIGIIYFLSFFAKALK